MVSDQKYAQHLLLFDHLIDQHPGQGPFVVVNSRSQAFRLRVECLVYYHPNGPVQTRETGTV